MKMTTFLAAAITVFSAAAARAQAVGHTVAGSAQSAEQVRLTAYRVERSPDGARQARLLPDGRLDIKELQGKSYDKEVETGAEFVSRQPDGVLSLLIAFPKWSSDGGYTAFDSRIDLMLDGRGEAFRRFEFETGDTGCFLYFTQNGPEWDGRFHARVALSADGSVHLRSSYPDRDDRLAMPELAAVMLRACRVMERQRAMFADAASMPLAEVSRAANASDAELGPIVAYAAAFDLLKTPLYAAVLKNAKEAK